MNAFERVAGRDNTGPTQNGDRKHSVDTARIQEDFNELTNIVEALEFGENCYRTLESFIKVAESWGVKYRLMEQKYDAMLRDVDALRSELATTRDELGGQRAANTQLKLDMDGVEAHCEFLQRKLRMIDENLNTSGQEKISSDGSAAELARPKYQTRGAAKRVPSSDNLILTSSSTSVDDFYPETKKEKKTSHHNAYQPYNPILEGANFVSRRIEKAHDSSRLIENAELISNKYYGTPYPENKKTVHMSTPNARKLANVNKINFTDEFKSPIASHNPLKNSTQIEEKEIPNNDDDLRKIEKNDDKSEYTGIIKYFPTTHHFKNITSSINSVCTTCDRKIGFRKQAKTCVSCKAVCHSECFNSLPNPCFSIPIHLTPSKTKTLCHLTPVKTKGMTLTRLCQDHSPSVPGILVHLFIQIERRGLAFVGLYTMNGPARTSRTLMDRYYSHGTIPNFSIVTDIGVLTDCVKDLFATLADALISPNAWAKFCRASINDNQLELVRLVTQLRPPRRDTLALLMLHLRRVLRHAEHNKAKRGVLARVFSDVLARSHANDEADAIQYFNKQENQVKILESLLALPDCTYIKILESEKMNMIKDLN